ncbi:arginine--tRNA ligase [Paenibacillus sp. BGI2013]|uniref:arginine--tRNA ligase n=1 Tax=Paenibacillus TaxID=44249 RepID=UPI00096E041A|nr:MULTISPECIES: arginine--tRNA ligase [Paenibacillus]OMF47891.1 arginine--tRNA ligase [Paenibacillus amylolyticus]PKQ93162.1 arginine--tRNA ligase [Paenibacillus sp. BGI2013]
MLMKQAAADITPLTGLNEEEVLRLLEVPPQAEMGDAAFPCFVLAKSLKKAPAVIATELATGLQASGIEATPAGPYVNIRFNREKLAPNLLKELGNAAFGKLQLGQGSRVVIDMSSPNIAKPFGIGHLRSTVIGAALYRLYNEAGYTSVSVNHLGDWGTQFGKQIAAYKRWGNDEALQADPIRTSLELYVRFHDEAENDPSLEIEAREWFRKLEQGDDEAQRLWAFFVEVSMKEFNRMYERLNVQFDHTLGESFYNDKMGAVVEELKAKGLLEESDGALVVRLEDENMPPCLIIKKDGTTIYPTRDLATAVYRHEVMKADRLLYVVGGEQRLHFRQVFAVLSRMGHEWSAKCEHIPFGLMRFEGRKMSTRRGKVVFLQEVLDEAVARALQIIQEKNPNLENPQKVAEAVGVGAIVFGDLRNSRLNDVDFSLEDAVSFEGETGPYVQYTHARIQSVLAKAEEAIRVENENPLPNPGLADGEIDTVTTPSCVGDTSWALLKLLGEYPEYLEKAIHRNEPSVIAKYTIDVAQAFNRFYHAERIADASSDVRSFRVALAKRTAERLAYSLHLLGVQAPERM